MAITHRDMQKDWNNAFATHNAILDQTPYEPEVLFIGTFNPGTNNANFSDFFYGRNYLWTGFKNYFVYNKVQIEKRRMPTKGRKADIVTNPTLSEIFELCTKLKLCFTDLILEVLHKNNPQYAILDNDNVIFNGNEYNLIQDGKSSEKLSYVSRKTLLGLEQLDIINQVHWNTENIISFLEQTPTIKTIYFTRKPTGVWGRELNKIKFHSCMQDRSLTNIYTPSGQRLKGTPRMNVLLRHWIFNKDKSFGTLNNNWLIQHGVTLENFV